MALTNLADRMANIDPDQTQRSPMQTEKSQHEGKRIKPETRCTKFGALSVDLRAGLSWTALETDDLLFFLPSTCIGKIIVFMTIFIIFLFFSFFFFFNNQCCMIV